MSASQPLASTPWQQWLKTNLDIVTGLFFLVISSVVVVTLVWHAVINMKGDKDKFDNALIYNVAAYEERYGEPQPESALPHKVGAEVTKIKEQGLAVTENKRAGEAPEPTLPRLSPEDLAKLADKENQQSGSGPSGSKSGNSQSENLEGDRYVGDLKQYIRERWGISEILKRRDPNWNTRKLTILLKISLDGSLEDYKLQTRSGNAEIDESVTSLLEQIKRGSYKEDPTEFHIIKKMPKPYGPVVAHLEKGELIIIEFDYSKEK